LDPRIIEQQLYGKLQNLRVDLYQAIAQHQLSYDWLHAFAGDVRQILERVETEIPAAEQRERHP